MFITTQESMYILSMQKSFGELSWNDHSTGWFGHFICFDDTRNNCSSILY